MTWILVRWLSGLWTPKGCDRFGPWTLRLAVTSFWVKTSAAGKGGPWSFRFIQWNLPCRWCCLYSCSNFPLGFSLDNGGSQSNWECSNWNLILSYEISFVREYRVLHLLKQKFDRKRIKLFQQMLTSPYFLSEGKLYGQTHRWRGHRLTFIWCTANGQHKEPPSVQSVPLVEIFWRHIFSSSIRRGRASDVTLFT